MSCRKHLLDALEYLHRNSKLRHGSNGLEFHHITAAMDMQWHAMGGGLKNETADHREIALILFRRLWQTMKSQPTLTLSGSTSRVLDRLEAIQCWWKAALGARWWKGELVVGDG
jgi:hypothetical protein